MNLPSCIAVVLSKPQALCLVRPGCADYHQDIHEEVDDVQVEGERGEDVFLWAEGVLVLPSHHQLSVIDDVHREDEGPERGVGDDGVLVLGQKDEEEPRFYVCQCTF